MCSNNIILQLHVEEIIIIINTIRVCSHVHNHVFDTIRNFVSCFFNAILHFEVRESMFLKIS